MQEEDDGVVAGRDREVQGLEIDVLIIYRVYLCECEYGNLNRSNR